MECDDHLASGCFIKCTVRWTRIMWIASAQDAQKAAGAILDVDRNPRLPHPHGKRRDALCHVLLGPVTWDHATAMPWPLSFPRRASCHLRRICRKAESRRGGDSAHCKSGTLGMASHNTILARFAIVLAHLLHECVGSQRCAQDGLHTSGSSSSTPGRQRVRSGSDTMSTSSWIPRLKRRGIRESPCSPPSHCTMSCKSVDGIGAYDHMFRGAMLSKMLSEPAWPPPVREGHVLGAITLHLAGWFNNTVALGLTSVYQSSNHVPHAIGACPRWKANWNGAHARTKKKTTHTKPRRRLRNTKPRHTRFLTEDLNVMSLTWTTTSSTRELKGKSDGHSHAIPGIFKDVRFYPILNFGLFWAPLFSRCFHPIMNFGHFWAPPFFKMSGFYPTRNFGHFWAALLKMSLNFPNFWAGFIATHHCLLCLPLCLPLVSCFGLGCVLCLRTLFAACCARFGMTASTNGHWILWDCTKLSTQQENKENKTQKKTKMNRNKQQRKTLGDRTI